MDITNYSLLHSSRIPHIDDEVESDYGSVYSILNSGMIIAKISGVEQYELVKIGHSGILGEVIRFDYNQATITAFESVNGVSVGDPVIRTRRPLFVELGPGILNNIYDGIQRPLKIVKEPNPIDLPQLMVGALNRQRMFEFKPVNYKVGDYVSGGDIFGEVVETELVKHLIMVPPKEKGKITFLAPVGNYSLVDIVLELEDKETIKEYTMVQIWPVRSPRPYNTSLVSEHPFTLGIRAHDALFPLAQGSKCAVINPNWIGTGGKMTLWHMVSKTNCDQVVHVVSGERMVDVVESILDREEITVKVEQKNYRLTDRMTIVANSSDMPVAIREASVYTGITIAEYFRDMGYNTLTIVDSLSRWAEALSCLTNQQQIDFHSSYLYSRIHSLYERAGRVSCLGSPVREGTVTILSSMSPSFEEWGEQPIISKILEMVQVNWRYTTKLARIKHFPNIDWLNSSSSTDNLDCYYETLDCEWPKIRSKAINILQQENQLIQTIQKLGKEDLSESDKSKLDISRLIRESFLQQNFFTSYDRYCPLYKTMWMLKNFILYYDRSQKLLSHQKFTWDEIKTQTQEIIKKLETMKFEEPSMGENAVIGSMTHLNNDIRDIFRVLLET